MPVREKLVLPEGYGRTTKMLSWENIGTQVGGGQAVLAGDESGEW